MSALRAQLGTAASADELGSGRRCGAAAAHGSGSQGRDRDTALLLSVSKADAGGKRRGLRVWSVGTPGAKGELYRWLKLEWPTDEALDEVKRDGGSGEAMCLRHAAGAPEPRRWRSQAACR
jgi:hypothetical protein